MVFICVIYSFVSRKYIIKQKLEINGLTYNIKDVLTYDEK